MYDVRRSGRFRRDVRLCEKRGKDMRKFNEVHRLLINGSSLPPKNRDHLLQGDWKGYRECHIDPDWLLIYRVSQKENVIEYMRMGTHFDLFP